MGGHQVDKSWGGDILRVFASYSFVFAPTFLIFVIESVWSLKASCFHLVMKGVSYICVDMASRSETSSASTEECFSAQE